MLRPRLLLLAAASAVLAAGCGGSSTASGPTTTSTTTTTVAAVGGPVDAATPAPSPTSTSSTTSTTAPPSAGSCPVGTWRQDGPPSGLTFNLESGGTGMILVIDRDGVVTQDWSEYVPGVGSQNGIRVTVAPTGVVRTRIDLSTPGNEWTGIEPPDLSGFGGNATTEVDGQTIDIPLNEVMAGLGTLEGARIGCAGADTLKVTAGPITYSFFRA